MEIVFWIIIAVLGIILIIKLVKNVMRFFAALFSIMLIIIGLFLLISAKGIYDFNKEFNNNSNIFFLLDQDKIVSGFRINNGEVFVFSDEVINKYDEFFTNEKYKKMLDGNYKMILFSKTAFKNSNSAEFYKNYKNSAAGKETRFILTKYVFDEAYVYPQSLLFYFLDLIPVV
ncbi:hypothetical protein GF327_02065 [Candidatus Woesearchaeota archaeon]|nr:hypothetical protein [Candidatus Woesearchaeota archaeon]